MPSPLLYRYLIDSIDNNGSRGITVKSGDAEIKLIAVRKDKQIFCYHNLCPHMGVNLDWIPDQFLDTSNNFIQCATHGALFQIEDGHCISGPCQGQNLSSVRVKTDEDYFEILLR
ncbi:MAG: Rieske 2Fe-2S domain-containing protein [Gammaproteobacteria bacterium]|nr:Rieske 2Fe-2S domain-containing protein [Gammaproteobacteria bacterium]